MIENIKIKTDDVGRIVIPKEFRRVYNLKKDTKLGVVKYKNSILLEKLEDIVTIDSFGRILLPKEIRKSYSIQPNSYILISTVNDGILMQSNMIKYHSLVNKLKYIEKEYNIKSLIIEGNHYEYINEEDNYLREITVNKLEKYLQNKHYHYNKKEININNYEKCSVVIYTKDNTKLLELVYKLL